MAFKSGLIMENKSFEPLLVSIDQAGQMLNLPRRTMYALMHRGSLPPSYKVGGRRVFRRADLIKWIDLGMPSLEKFLVLTGGKK